MFQEENLEKENKLIKSLIPKINEYFGKKNISSNKNFQIS